MSSQPVDAESESISDPGNPGAGELVDVSPPEDESAGPTNSPVADRVYGLLGPVVATAGVELLDIEWTGGTLRVVLDHPDGVTTDSLTAVNRLISPILDQHDPVPGRYTLEVSSPGVERPLRRLEHYRRAVGESITAKLIPGSDRRRVKGLLKSVSDTGLEIEVVEVDGVDLTAPETMSVDLADIASARTVFDWGPGPKPGTGKRPGAKTAKQSKSDSAAQNKDRKQSQRKAKKSPGAKQAGNSSNKKPSNTKPSNTKPSNKKPSNSQGGRSESTAGSGAAQSKKPQPNTAEQERGRP